MLYQVESMFDDMEKKMRRLKKQKYEENMENFMAANEAYFLEMEVYLDKGDPEKGKIKGTVQADLNFFMIYYVFPAILKRNHEYAKLLADTLCETWGSSFKNSKIGYTDYETLYKAFREKIFGIF